jgi:hypothetical protein
MNQLRTFRLFAFLALLNLLIPVMLWAQGSVTVLLHRPPPNQLRVADLWVVDLTNTTNGTLTIHLRGTVDEATDGPIVEATSKVFRLPPGFHRVTASDIQPIDAKYDESPKRYDYKAVFLRTNQAPTGDYRVCDEVVEDSTGNVLGTYCYDQSVQVITPPVLVAPFNESVVADKYPNFAWLPPAPVGPNQQIRYQLKIVEVLGQQTPYDAMTSNPAYFVRDGVAGTLFPYPLSARAFRENQTYAWQIVATSDRFPMGESEIWWFNYNSRIFGQDSEDTGNPILNPRSRDLGSPIGIDRKTLLLSPIGRGTLVTGDVDTEETYLRKLDPGLIDALLTKRYAIPQAILKELLRSCTGP